MDLKGRVFVRQPRRQSRIHNVTVYFQTAFGSDRRRLIRPTIRHDHQQQRLVGRQMGAQIAHVAVVDAGVVALGDDATDQRTDCATDQRTDDGTGQIDPYAGDKPDRAADKAAQFAALVRAGIAALVDALMGDDGHIGDTQVLSLVHLLQLPPDRLSPVYL